MAGKATLAEIMGKKGASSEDKEGGFDFEDLDALLGEGAPKLEFHPLGRLRLIRSLKNRFGAGFRNVPGISGLIKKFDNESGFALRVAKLKQIRVKGK